MIPVETPDTDFSYHLPGRPGEGEMPCIREGHRTTSFWRPEPDDRIEGAIYVSLDGYWGPVEVGFGATIAEATLEPRVPIQFDGAHGAHQTNVPITDAVREYLASGGLFVLRVGMAPPPPVSVWFATAARS